MCSPAAGTGPPEEHTTVNFRPVHTTTPAPPGSGRYLRHLHVVLWRLSSVVARLPLPLVADALDEVLVEVADVEVSDLWRSGVTVESSLTG